MMNHIGIFKLYHVTSLTLIKNMRRLAKARFLHSLGKCRRGRIFGYHNNRKFTNCLHFTKCDILTKCGLSGWAMHA